MVLFVPLMVALWCCEQSASGLELTHLDPASGKVLDSFSIPLKAEQWGFAVSPTGRRASLVGNLDENGGRRLTVVDLHAGRIEETLTIEARLSWLMACAWSTDDELLLSGHPPGGSSNMLFSLKAPFKQLVGEGLVKGPRGLTSNNSAEQALAALRRVRDSGVEPLVPALHSAKSEFELLDFISPNDGHSAYNAQSGTLLVIGRRGGKGGLWLIVPDGPHLIVEGVNAIPQFFEFGSLFLAVTSRDREQPTIIACEQATGKLLWKRKCTFLGMGRGTGVRHVFETLSGRVLLLVF